MMIVIIPHQTEELKLIRFQKELIKQLNSQKDIFYAQQPLWIEIEDFSPSSKKELKELSKKLKNLRFSSLKKMMKDFFSRLKLNTKKKNSFTGFPFFIYTRDKCLDLR